MFLLSAKRDILALYVQCALLWKETNTCDKELMGAQNALTRSKMHFELFLSYSFSYFTLVASFSSIFERRENQIYQF